VRNVRESRRRRRSTLDESVGRGRDEHVTVATCVVVVAAAAAAASELEGVDR
jgi:hypothetical protein